ncbi:MAG: ArsC/Spx/MgsR family protein [Candidatus Omnitrophota bacterium]
MEKITVYQKPTCTTCREVYAALKAGNVDFDAVDYYIEPISKAKLKELLSKMGISAKELLRSKDAKYKELKFDEKNYSESEILDLMMIYPDLIQRPIVEKGEKAILARPAERLKEILS